MAFNLGHACLSHGRFRGSLLQPQPGWRSGDCCTGRLLALGCSQALLVIVLGERRIQGLHARPEYLRRAFVNGTHTLSGLTVVMRLHPPAGIGKCTRQDPSSGGVPWQTMQEPCDQRTSYGPNNPHSPFGDPSVFHPLCLSNSNLSV